MSLALLASLKADEPHDLGPLPAVGGVYDPTGEWE